MVRSADTFLSAGSIPPCTIPNSACVAPAHVGPDVLVWAAERSSAPQVLLASPLSFRGKPEIGCSAAAGYWAPGSGYRLSLGPSFLRFSKSFFDRSAHRSVVAIDWRTRAGP